MGFRSLSALRDPRPSLASCWEGCVFYLSMLGAMDSGIRERRTSIANKPVSTIGLGGPGSLGNRAGRSISLAERI
jgi:hypothetical protein